MICIALERVQKIIANAGFCSRRKAEELIEKGLVLVNGKKIKLGDKASDLDTILVDGKYLSREQKRYILLNKPFGYTTTMDDPHEKNIIRDLLRVKERVFPVGRLDKYTGGMLLLTNDGDFANKVMHPRYELDKTYYVKTKKPLHVEDLNKLAFGIHLEDGKTAPARVKRLSPQEIELTIHEGRNRIVRRMVEALENEVQVLIRIQIGRLKLGQLKPGYYRNLTEQELRLVLPRERKEPGEELQTRRFKPRTQSGRFKGKRNIYK